MVEGSNKGAHTTLLYKNPNGKYVFNNYEQSFEIDDPNITNIKDAIAYVNKYATLQSVGMLAIQDTEGHSYSEFAYKKEAPFGDEMDKRDENALTPFNSNLPKKSNISASVEKSNIGNFSAKVGTTKLYQEYGKDKASSYTVGYKKTGESDMFQNSYGIGVKYEKNFKNNVNGKYNNTKVIADFVNGKTVAHNNSHTLYVYDNDNHYKTYMKEFETFKNNTIANFEANYKAEDYFERLDDLKKALNSRQKDYEYLYDKEKDDLIIYNETTLGSPERDIKLATVSVSGNVGKEFKLVDNDKFNLAGRAQGSYYVNLSKTIGNTGIGGDYRLMGEAALKAETKSENIQTSTVLNAGVLDDMNLEYAVFMPKLALGTKVNIGTDVRAQLSPSLAIQAGAGGYYVKTNPAKDYGVQVGVAGKYDVPNSKVSLYGGANASIEKQKLSLGLFNERTEDNLKYGVTVGADIGNKTNVSVNYRKESDKLCPIHNNSTVLVNFGVKL